MDVEYRRCKSGFVDNLKFPNLRRQDGSVVMLNTTTGPLEQLNQTYDLTNGYWTVSVLKLLKNNEKPRLNGMSIKWFVMHGKTGEHLARIVLTT